MTQRVVQVVAIGLVAAYPCFLFVRVALSDLLAALNQKRALEDHLNAKPEPLSIEEYLA